MLEKHQVTVRSMGGVIGMRAKIDDADARIEIIKVEKQESPSKEKKVSRIKENEAPKRNELTIELVTEEYVNKNITLYEVAKKLNVSIQDLYTFVKKNNLKKRVTKNQVVKSEIKGVNIGVYKICGCCEKEFFIPVAEQWAYKKVRNNRVTWFHCYSCMQAFDKF